jgi:hypothetical protein
MKIHTVFIRPAYPPDQADLVRTNMLPHMLRLEVGDPGPRLAAKMLYGRPLETVDSIAMLRWTLSYDLGNGRIARLDFRDDRPDPETPYDEMADALEWIRERAKALPKDQAWHFGLLTSSAALSLDWFTRVDEIRPLLKPPFPDAPA